VGRAEAINRAAIAKEIGAQPWKGFATPAKSKTRPTTSRRKLTPEEQKKQHAKDFDDWLAVFNAHHGSTETRPESTANSTHDVVDDACQQCREEKATDYPLEEDEPPPAPEVTSPAEEVEEAATAAAAEEETSRRSDRRELTEECPFYIINRKLANCRVLTSTERCCIGLLNSLMQKHGYAFVSNEQLALWLCMKSPDSVRNMLAKLAKAGFLKDTGRSNLEVRWVVREDLRNPKRTAR
jgi:Helix-turn-helix domain